MAATLTKVDFEAYRESKVRVKRVDVPELNGACFIRVLPARERDAYDTSINDGVHRDVTNCSARLVVLCLCDESGQPLFDDIAAGEQLLGDSFTLMVDPLFFECRSFNRIGGAALEEAVKNSEPTGESASSTDLPDL